MNKIIYGYNDEPMTIAEICEYVGPGWTKLVTKLCEDLFADGWDGRLLQIKEKFGGLRFYISAESENAYALIDAAERESDRTCDVCGAPGHQTGRGWIVTRCDEHDDQHAKN